MTATFSSAAQSNVTADIYQMIDSLSNPSLPAAEKNLDDYIKSVEKALTMSIQLNYVKGQVQALTTLSGFYLIKEDYVKTLDMYFKGIDIYERRHDIDNLILQYAQVTQLFLLIKDYDLEEKYINLMERIAQKSAGPTSPGLVFLSKAKFRLDKGEYDLAIRNLYLCIPFFQKAGDISREGSVYKFLGDAFVQKERYGQAEFNYRLAINLFSKIPNPTEIATIYTRLAHISHLVKDEHSNLEFNLSAMRIREKTVHSKLISSSYLNVGEAYWVLGKKDSAYYYLQKSLLLAEKIQYTFLLEVVNKLLSDYAFTENRYADGLNYFVAYIDNRTKKNHDRNRTDISVLIANRTIRASEMHNDIIKQEVLIQDLQIRNRRIQIFLFEVAFIITLILTLFVDTLSRKNRNRKNELKELNARLTQEIDIRIEAEGRLTRSIALHRFLAENTIDVISRLDANLHRIYISPSCEKFYGYRAEEILKMQSPLELIDPSFHRAVNQQLQEIMRTKTSTRLIYKVVRKNGSTRWAEVNINPVLEPASNEIMSLITVVRDVSDRVKYDEELSENSRQKEYLLHEIHNRVKNNFAILISLMNMQRNQSANPELSSSLTDLQLRVRTMSLVHEQLYLNQDISSISFDNYLHHLSHTISSSFSNTRIQLQTDINPCNVSIEMALPLGLIINELITNAFKYAFPGDRTGTIRVKLLPESDNKYCISICDDGVGLPPGFSRNNLQSMGLQIVGMLVEQLEASLEISSPGGTCFKVVFSTTQE